MNRKLVVVTGILWLGGLVAAIVGMNMEGNSGQWLTIGGNAAFLIGLALAGVIWALKSKEKAPSAETPERQGDTGEAERPEKAETAETAEKTGDQQGQS